LIVEIRCELTNKDIIKIGEMTRVKFKTGVIILTLGLVIGMITTVYGQNEVNLETLTESLKDSSLTTIVYEGVSLREIPNTSSKVIFVLTEDKRGTVVDYNNLHFKVCIDSICGYVDEKSIFPSVELINFIKEYRKVKKEVDEVVLVKKRISINYVNIIDINSLGGVNFGISWRYFDKSKVIKYIYFTVVPFNAVGDRQSGEIGGHSTFTGQVTGPIHGSFNFESSVWKNAWYNNSIRCIKLTKVRVEYTDGSTYTYLNELPKILDTNFSNNCDYKE